MNHRERNIILLSVGFVLFLGGTMTMLIIGVSFKSDYDDTDVHKAADCTLHNGWVGDKDDSSFAAFNASLIAANSEILVWGVAQGIFGLTPTVEDIIAGMKFPNQTTCYYIPDKIDYESQTNEFLLTYNRDESYANYVGLAVGGSITIVIAVGSLLVAIFFCALSGRESNVKTPDDYHAHDHK